MTTPISNSRRGFFKASAAAGALLASGSALAQEAPVSSIKADQLPSGKLLTFGMRSERFTPVDGFIPTRGQHSILTSIDIPTGKTKATALDMGGEGHLAMGVGDGRILCTGHHQARSMMVDPDHKPMAVYTAPAGYVYGGHGLVLADRGIFILPARVKIAQTTADTGILQVYDLATLKLVDQLDSGGVHPHEPHIIPGTDEIVVSHYGDVYPAPMPFEHDVKDGKLTIYDAKTLKVKRHYEQNDLKAMTTHLQVNKHGVAYFVLTQYVRFEWEKHRGNLSSMFAGADEHLEQITGKKREYNHSQHALAEGRLAVPLPLVRVNTQTGERQLIFTEPENHLRGQTVGKNSLTDTILATFFHSDTLIMHTEGGEPELVTGAQLGLTDLRGVTDIPGTPFVALHGSEKNVAVFNVQTKEVVARHRCDNFYSVHVGYTPV